MSDLISRSAVINILKECYLDEQLFEKDVFDKIKAMPTAYDVDAVVKELSKYKNFVTIQARNFVQTCINIVKAGGRV